MPHSLTNELLPFMSPWNIVYISKLRRYCIRPGASGRISTSQWAFHNLARPRVVCVGTGHQGHVHIYIDQGYAVTPLPQLQIQLYLYPWDGWDWWLPSGALLSGLQNRYSNSQSTRTTNTIEIELLVLCCQHKCFIIFQNVLTFYKTTIKGCQHVRVHFKVIVATRCTNRHKSPNTRVSVLRLLILSPDN